jgi:hypothetical protein
VSLRTLLPYLLIFAVLAGYLFYRMRTALMAPHRRSGATQWRDRALKRRRLRISEGRSWDDLGHRTAAPAPPERREGGEDA